MVDTYNDIMESIDYAAGLPASNAQSSNINWGNVLSGVAGLFGATAPVIGGGLAAKSAYDRLGTIGEAAQQGAQQVAQQGLEQTQFKPFTVTSSTGGMFAADPGGNVSMGLGAQEQAIQNALMAQAQQGIAGGFGGDPMQQAAAQQAYGLGGQFMGMAGQNPMQRERDIYGNIRAMQTPEEQRQRMALEERLFTQGRGGVSTNLYGGTPEQLAMAKAQAEAQNRASLIAMQQAQAEQLQQADIASTFTGLGSTLGARDLAAQQLQQQLALGNLVGAYAPQNQLLALQQASQLFPQLQQKGQLYGAGLFGEASMGGLEALLGSGLGQANLMGQLGTGLLTGLSTPTDSYGGLSELFGKAVDFGGDIFDALGFGSSNTEGS
jgi:hypothetical protein